MLWNVQDAITPSHIAHWRGQFVYALAPYYLAERSWADLPSDTLMFSRSEFAAQRLALSILDTYAHSQIDPQASHVVMLTAQAVQALADSQRHNLLMWQWQYGRGQVYPSAFIAPLLSDIAEVLVAPWQVDTAAGQMLVLDAVLWDRLPTAVQAQWLRLFVATQQAPYPCFDTSILTEALGVAARRDGVRRLANTFAYMSGPNCFALSIAAITGDVALAESVSGVWLHEQPFLRALRQRGYTTQSSYTGARLITHDAIYVWADAHGQLQHACYVLGDGVALNKNAQAWFAPCHLAHIQDIIAYWRDDALTVTMYTPS